MKFRYYTIVASLLFIFSNGYAQKKTSKTAKSWNDSIMVIPIGEPLPDSCKLIGPLNVGDNGYNMGCDVGSIVDFAKTIAGRVKANIIKINASKPPDNWCECYRIYASMYYRKNIWNAKKGKYDDSVAKAKFGDTAKFAILYVYRGKKSKESLLGGYNVHIGNSDSSICQAKNNSANEIKLTKEGKIYLSAMTESESGVILDVKFGEEYYLKCSSQMGVLVREPKLELIDRNEGRAEYDIVKRGQ